LRTARKLTARPSRNDWAGLHAPARLHRIIECERARTDRNGDPFTLITLTLRNSETDRATLLYLARVLKRRLRLIDEAGWLSDRQLAVVLPSTPTAGAWKVADDVCLSVPPNQPLPVCKVYCYPADWLESRDERATAETQPVAAGRLSAGAKAGEPLETLFSLPVPPWKRAIDVLGAGTGLLLLAPLFAAVAAAIKLASPGPVLFKQLRSGRAGRPFTMYKFRSMVVDAEQKKFDLLALNEQDGPAFKIEADPRVTRFGRFLRSTSIDELPQLWNVLRGEMSLVGPRPLPCHESDGCLGWQRRRLDVTPGLTCIWQVKGRSRVSFSEWCRMDLQYVARRGVRQDLMLLLLTLPAVLLRKGAR
jgi:lipopolysaccharide/colanic/teichoic acid biosynthesis glycosyltransferase